MNKSTTPKGRRKAASFVLCAIPMLCVVLSMIGCGSMTIQTEQAKVDYVMDNYLPEGTHVQFYSEYEAEKLLGGSQGKTWCNDWDVRNNCTIKTVRNAEVLLHEICHVLEHGWHGAYQHSGLQGCESFNYNTLARM